MKAYKIELLIIDHDEIGQAEIKDVLENTKYPNYCISPDVKKIIEADIGDWTDENPLNRLSSCETEYERLFSDANMRTTNSSPSLPLVPNYRL
jgi:hypothetical protein